MARILYTDPRDYREPFIIIKIKKQNHLGMVEAQQQGETLYSRLIYASIMRQRQAQTEEDGRNESDTLSIKFRKTELNIEIGDYVYRNKKIYNITAIDKDLFNLQEQKITAVFYKNLDAMPIIKNYLENLQQEEVKEADRLLVKDATAIMNDVENIKEQIKQLKENLTQQINQLNQKREELAQQVRILEEQKNQIKNQVQTLETKTQTVQQKVEANEQFIGMLNDEIQKLKKK